MTHIDGATSPGELHHWGCHQQSIPFLLQFSPATCICTFTTWPQPLAQNHLPRHPVQKGRVNKPTQFHTLILLRLLLCASSTFDNHMNKAKNRSRTSGYWHEPGAQRMKDATHPPMVAHYEVAEKSFYPSTYTYTRDDLPGWSCLVCSKWNRLEYDSSLLSWVWRLMRETTTHFLTPRSQHFIRWKTDFSFISITVNICSKWLKERVPPLHRSLHCWVLEARIQDYKCGWGWSIPSVWDAIILKIYSHFRWQKAVKYGEVGRVSRFGSSWLLILDDRIPNGRYAEDKTLSVKQESKFLLKPCCKVFNTENAIFLNFNWWTLRSPRGPKVL